MLKLKLSVFLALSGLCYSQDSLIVTTTLGKIKGHYRLTPANITYEAYEGIPYAQPPLGNNRFQPPVPIKPWKGVISADKRKNACWGYMTRRLNPKLYTGTEDCLYLNVYVPKKKLHRPLTVIIYLYAGAFQFSSLQGFEQNHFMDKDVIFVTFNHRHGILGFLSTEDNVVSGNMGLKDQVLVLKWVKQHIAQFGGDSSRITLLGNSAGGASIHYHYLSPMSYGLFNCGISISSTALMPWAQAKDSRNKAFRVGKLVNCTTSDTQEMIRCLRSKPARTLVEAQPKFMGWRKTDFAPFGPVVEKNTINAFIDRAPIEILNSGDVQNLPWITGTVSEEGLLSTAEFGTNQSVLEELDRNWEIIAPQLLQYYYTIPKSQHTKVARRIRHHYFGDKPINKENLMTLTRLVGDRIIISDSVKAAKLQAQVTSAPVYYYYFPYEPVFSLSQVLSGSKENLGTAHGDDGTILLTELGTSKREKNDLSMQKKLVDLWVSVAYTGQPKAEPEWRKLNPRSGNFRYLEMDGPGYFKMITNNTFANNQFWNSINFNENKL